MQDAGREGREEGGRREEELSYCLETHEITSNLIHSLHYVLLVRGQNRNVTRIM